MSTTQRSLNAVFVTILAARQGSGVREEKLKLERLWFCALGLFWDNDKAHESPGMPDRPRLCLISKREPSTALGKGLWDWHGCRISRLVLGRGGDRRRGGDPELS